MNVKDLYKAANIEQLFHDPNAGRLTINLNKVVDSNLVPGLKVETKEIEDGVDVAIKVQDEVVIERPVHLCFGVTQESAIQRINMNMTVGKHAQIRVLSHCIFPTAVDIKHLMDAQIVVGEGAKYEYFERHVHSPDGGIEVVPRAKVELKKDARFKTDFELIRGRVGIIDIDYETTCGKNSVMEMTAKVSGKGDDVIKINEKGYLNGERARGVLTTKIAVRENATAEVYNVLSADSPYALGHVDCKEIIQDNGSARAIPIVEVKHPKAHITHEAAIGSVDNKQLETLMSRGLSEDEATELIIQGLLS